MTFHIPCAKRGLVEARIGRGYLSLTPSNTAEIDNERDGAGMG